jgi:membrane associated rhomboid family serine protease
MLHQYPIVLLSLIVVTAVVSWRCFVDQTVENRLSFKPRPILAYKEYYRLVSSAFVHADLIHLLLNCATLYAFGEDIEFAYGAPLLLGIYFSSIIGGSLLSLWMHRHHEYCAVGASGGVCGVMYASIFLFPGQEIAPGIFPIFLPGYLYGLVYLVTSYYALRRHSGKIGHDAHIGGAIVGLFFAMAFYPSYFLASPILLTLIVCCSLGILYRLYTDPLWLERIPQLIQRQQYKPNIRYQRYDDPKEVMTQSKARKEIDALLDKVSQKGFASLSEKEKERLKKLSEEIK